MANIDYYIVRIREKSSDSFLRFILKVSTYFEKLLKKFVYHLESTLDDSLTKVRMPPIESVINEADILITKKDHIIGNSHAHTFTGSELGKYARGNSQKSFWDSYSLGPLSSIDIESSKFPLLTKVIEKYEFRELDYILLPLGEAECRWYALKDRNLPMEPTEEELNSILKPYLQAAMDVNLALANLGMRPIIWGGHASSRLGPRVDKDIPIAGESVIRNRLSVVWEKAMRNFAKEHNFPFVSILSLMLDENLETREGFLLDACHLKTDLLEGFLLGEFRNLLIDLEVER